MAAPAESAAARLAVLCELLPQCASRDRRRLQATFERLARRRSRPVDPRELSRLETQVQASTAWVAARRASLPPIRYDETLPVHARREQIAAAIREQQVVIVSGATGSGKSTQLPKICLELGRGLTGMIGHTQPRRIAAQALANRISVELGSTTGDLVGYQVRFVDRTSPRTLVKLMTDGVLLRELERDPQLLRYDTLIIDEAHERNLNVDFLLGVCKRLLPQRPDLRLIVTSATIETQRFAEYFGKAPVLDVEGQAYPVEVRYRPIEEERDEAPSLPEAVRDAIQELERDARGLRGDALVFLPGEKQIVETRDLLVRSRVDWDVLPLYGRLAGPEQDKVFARHERRRVVLATNVAETSLTIPGVRFVVDAGLARISRYSPRVKFQRLPIEPVSQASADQRRGRCGREGEGICLRLYSEDDYLARPRYTEPEILRTNLASLVLQMAALGLGSPDEFPFLDPPDARLLNDGYRLLQELSAVDGDRRITRIGRQMASLPVDPRLARVLVEAARMGCLEPCLTIVAFLSIQDPRERPSDQTAAADEKHALFADERSDFVGVLNLWHASREPAAGGNRALRRWCHEHFLSFLRMREWADLRDQLADIARTDVRTGLVGSPHPATVRDAVSPSHTVLHQALLTGFLGGIGVLDEARTYLGARDTRFVIAPGTPLQRRSPHWIVAASLVETQRLYARMVAQVQPSWIESAGAHLVRRTYGDAEWDASRGMAHARETVTLYGRVLSTGRRVNFATVDPVAARRMFVEEALVRRQPPLPFAFLDRNDETRARVEHVEACLRRRDLLAGEERLVQFYLERIPPDVATTRAFERWWRSEEQQHPHRLDAPESVLVAQPLPAIDRFDFPTSLEVQENLLPLHYHYDPTSDRDGVTVDVPLPLLRALDAQRIEWLIPGWLREKIVLLLRGLPKDVRRELVPIPDAADRLLTLLPRFGQGSLFAHVAAFATREAGVVVEPEQVAAVPLPPWLSFNLRVLDAAGKPLRESRDLRALREELRSRSGVSSFAQLSDLTERAGIRRWDFGDLPIETTVRSGALRLRAFPGLQDEGTSVRLRLYTNEATARRATRGGLLRLAALAVPQQHDLVRRQLASDREFTLLVAAAGFGQELMQEIADRAVQDAILPAELWQGTTERWPRTREAFDALVDAGRAQVVDRGLELARTAGAVLESLREVRALLGSMGAPAFTSVRDSVAQQLAGMLAPGWIRSTPDAWWGQLPKYVRAMVRRLERARGDVERDRRLQAQVEPYSVELGRLVAAADPDTPALARERLRWMLEEFRLSLFAQELRTLQPVSARRLDEQLELARREARGLTVTSPTTSRTA